VLASLASAARAGASGEASRKAAMSKPADVSDFI
jgi:hypothetical protein